MWKFYKVKFEKNIYYELRYISYNFTLTVETLCLVNQIWKFFSRQDKNAVGLHRPHLPPPPSLTQLEVCRSRIHTFAMGATDSIWDYSPFNIQPIFWTLTYKKTRHTLWTLKLLYKLSRLWTLKLLYKL
jgi:hypothetical protein